MEMGSVWLKKCDFGARERDLAEDIYLGAVT